MMSDAALKAAPREIIARVAWSYSVSGDDYLASEILKALEAAGYSVSAPTLPAYRAMVEFQTEENVRDGVASGTSIVYEAKDNAQAVADLRRWWEGRHKAIPDHFHRLCCVKLSRYIVMPIDEHDICRTGTNVGDFYEWKMDTLGRGDGPLHFLTGSEVW